MVLCNVHVDRSGAAWIRQVGDTYVRSGLNSDCFHIIGDGHQPYSRGLYTHYKDSLLEVG